MPLVLGSQTDTWQTWNVRVTTSSATTTSVWEDWNQTWTMGTSSATTNAWSSWNNQWTRTYTITNSNAAVWNGWVDGTGTAIRVHSMQDLQVLQDSSRVMPRAPQRSQEEWARLRAEQEARREERDRLQAAARAEAHKLLSFVLSKAQMASYEARRFFDVEGSEGGVYRIHHGTAGNIRQLVDGREVNRLCVHPALYDGIGHLPTEDVLAAQALALMHDERTAVLTANVHEGRRHLRAVA